ncbi:transposase [Streptococcus hyointestinalis]|uniref:Transposase n=1 Tax=Streptococcus hyointestinalis TaxID=1337 RepID=A0A380KG20_9STRE|nr:transposase [Streptococcus hyointestinalis]
MKNKHLTLSDRNDIQIGIEQLKTFSAIATKLGKDPSTISKEVRRNRVVKENSVTSNCEACPLLKKAPYVLMPVRKREAIVDTRNSSTTQKELSWIMKLSSQIREQVLP